MERETVPLSKAASFLLDECRMVLPGIQALFGFQLIAVFNQRFQELIKWQQGLHYIALVAVAISVGLIMTPAAYHRMVNPREVTESFIGLASRLVLFSMLPLALGISLDVFLIGRMVFGPPLLAFALGFALFTYFCGLWLFLPLRCRRTAGNGRS